MTDTLRLTIGFVAIARPTFDLPLANEVTAAARGTLAEAGITLVGPDDLISSADEAAAAAQGLAAERLDALVVFQSTFADSTPVMRLAELVDAPLVLWAIPEASTGGRLRLNSLCGINLAGHSLTRAYHRYDTIYAPPDDLGAVETVQTVARAGRVRRLLRQARIGRVGTHPDGFDTCRLDAPALRERFGVEVVQIELDTVFAGARAVAPAAVETAHQELQPRMQGLDEVDQAALRGTLATYITLRDMAERERLAGFAVRCWSQFFTDLGCAACGALAMMTDERTPCSCETDVNGTITQLMLQWASGGVAFGSDIVSFDLAANTAVFWHCGKAPLSMADPAFQPRAAIHSNRQLPLLMEFPLRPGRVTLARLSEATGEYRLVVGGGEVIQAPVSFSGTSGVVRFDRPASEVLDTILSEGLEHHLALVYGDHVAVLLALARMLDLPVLRL